MLYRILSIIGIIVVAVITWNVVQDVAAQDIPEDNTPVYVIDNDRVDENAEGDAVVDPTADPSDDNGDVEVVDTLADGEAEQMMDDDMDEVEADMEQGQSSSIDTDDEDMDDDMNEPALPTTTAGVEAQGQMMDEEEDDDDDNDGAVSPSRPTVLPNTGVSLK